MIQPVKNTPAYPKGHLLAASGIAATLSLMLLLFPSREVEAKKSQLDLSLTKDSSLYLPSGHDFQTVLPMDMVRSLSVGVDSTAGTLDIPEPTVERSHSITVENGDTLSTIFERAGLSAETLQQALQSTKNDEKLTKLAIGQVLEFKLSPSGDLEQLSSALSDLESISLHKTNDGFSFQQDRIKPEIRPAYAHGIIVNSLDRSVKRAGLPRSMTNSLAEVFAYDIDFTKDIVKGDEFEVIYEEKIAKGKVVGSGKILAARFNVRDKTFTAIRYTNKQGTSSYYDAEGNAARKAFLRSPVDFARISSRFSMGRHHPILNKIRAHKGVDYAAQTGTPIKASGDGRVVLAGRNGGYGNTVIIQHGNNYRTLYAHMRGFAKGVRNGSPVKQGQVIGYVGTTGLSTGPHLHYEFQVNGRHVDPLSQKLPISDPIDQNEKNRFLELSKPLMARMNQEKASMLALKQP